MLKAIEFQINGYKQLLEETKSHDFFRDNTSFDPFLGLEVAKTNIKENLKHWLKEYIKETEQK